jgi:hypothetical protein
VQALQGEEVYREVQEKGEEEKEVAVPPGR